MPYKFVNRHDWGENLLDKVVKEKRKFQGGEGEGYITNEIVWCLIKRICQSVIGLFLITT